MSRRAPFPDNESRRVATLDDYALLDTSGDVLYHSLTALAARICATPMSLIVLVDRDRQWFKANVGFDGIYETGRDIAFCAHTILADDILEIPDASLDERFADNPLVEGYPFVRFYAGVPLVVADGQALGTLCVLDRVPRALTIEQRDALKAIAKTIVDQFETHRVQQRLLDDAAVESYEFDARSLGVIALSSGAQRNLDYSLDEARGLTISDLIPSLQRADARERIVALRDDPDPRLRLRTEMRRKDGATYPIDLRLQWCRSAGGGRLMAVGLEQSAASAIRDRMELLSVAVDSIHDAVVIASGSRTRPGVDAIVHVNETYLAATGADRHDVIGRSTEIFYGPNTDRAAVAEMWRRLLRGESATVQFVAYRVDGAEYLCEMVARTLAGANDESFYVLFTQRDVSATLAREASVEALNERLTTLSQLARNVFASLDRRALVGVLVRGVAELTHGGTAMVLARGTGDEFIETHDLLSRAATAVANDEFLRTVATRSEVRLSADGRRAGVPILATSGVVSHLLDIRAGERRFIETDAAAFELLGQYFAVAIRNVELYAELAARRAAVIELNQVKNDLIAMLAHDFKGPLTTIVGLAEVLAEDDRFDSESRQFLGMINSSAMRLASLASDTLALSRLEQNALSLRFDRVDLVALLRDIVRVFSVTRAIDMRSAAEALVVRADAARLRQVFENLIGNAIKYSPRGETVEVKLREKRGGIEVAIRDRGIGVPAGDLSKLFGRFARAANARELGIGGTGFGLFISRTIVEMHGGRIGVESQEGRGSTFRVFIPTVPAPQPTLDRRVLLLDSKDEGRSFIAHTLREEGYAVDSVADEAALVAALDETRYDAAIVDIDRLIMSASDLVKQIAHRTTLVRLVSTIDSESTGWDAALAKPFLIKDLQLILESAVAERRRAPRSTERTTTDAANSAGSAE